MNIVKITVTAAALAFFAASCCPTPKASCCGTGGTCCSAPSK